MEDEREEKDEGKREGEMYRCRRGKEVIGEGWWYCR